MQREGMTFLSVELSLPAVSPQSLGQVTSRRWNWACSCRGHHKAGGGGNGAFVGTGRGPWLSREPGPKPQGLGSTLGQLCMLSAGAWSCPGRAVAVTQGCCGSQRSEALPAHTDSRVVWRPRFLLLPGGCREQGCCRGLSLLGARSLSFARHSPEGAGR